MEKGKAVEDITNSLKKLDLNPKFNSKSSYVSPTVQSISKCRLSLPLPLNHLSHLYCLVLISISGQKIGIGIATEFLN